MITVILIQSEDMLQFDFAGHAGYAEKGKDIVCAGVSALYYALTEGVRRQAPDAVSVSRKSVTIHLSSTAAAAVSEAVVTGLPKLIPAICLFGEYPAELSVRHMTINCAA